MKTFQKISLLFLIVTQMCVAQGFWTKVGDMPEIRYAHTVNELDGKIYIVGGANSEGSPFPTNTLIYDRATGVWTQIPLFNNQIRQMHVSCVVGNKLYVVGGNDGINTIATMEVLDPLTNEWTPKTPMPTDRGLPVCASVDGKIYVIGGVRGPLGSPDYSGLKTVEVYDTTSNSWSTLADMPTKRWGSSAVVYNGKIYVVGGVTFFPTTVYNSVEVYDPQNGTWNTITQLAPMPTARYCFTTCLLDNNIYAIGGWYHSSNGPIYDKVEVYNIQNDEWHSDNSLPIPICASSVVYNDKIYLYGGTYTTHPNIGHSAIYEFSNKDIFALQPYINKSYARNNIDSVLLITRFKNIYQHQFIPHLIYSDINNTQIDSLLFFDDGLHGDSLASDGLYSATIPARQSEDFFTLSISTVDAQTNTYYDTPNRCRFTTAGPIKLDSVSYRKGLLNYHYVRPFVHNSGKVKTIPKVTLKVRSNDPWIEAIGNSSTGTAIPDIAPDSSVGISTWITIKTIDSLFPGYFNIKVEVASNGWTYWEDSIQVVITGVENEETAAFDFKLEQNYPNPFNPSTKISWHSPERSWQTLKIYDVLGDEIATLVDGEKEAGYHSVDFNGSDLPSGVYFYQLSAGNFIETKKMMLLK